MDFKNNGKYFNVNNTILYIGIGMAAVGVLFYFIGAIAMIRFLSFIALPIAIIGGVVIVFGASGRVHDADIDKQVKAQCREIDRDAREKFNLEDKDIRTLPPYQTEAFEFSEDVGANIRKGSDNKYRSSVYVATYLMYSNECIYVYTNRYSVLDADLNSIDAYTISYMNISDAEIVPVEYSIIKKDKKTTVKNYYLTIRYKDGNAQKILTLNDADADTAVTNIKRLAERAQKQAEELAKA